MEGGHTFEGGIWLKSYSQGTAVNPIVISSYGKGRATVSSGNGFGFYGHNNAGIELRRLNFVGSGRLNNKNSGVVFYLDSAATQLQHLRLDSLDVSGYRSVGISVGSWKGTSGYTDVRITNSRSHANGEAGISSYAEELRAHHNWYVGNCKAYDNSGRTDITNTHTGNGIVLSGIDGALIEHCEAYNNGWLNSNPAGGPVGIWGWCCNNLIIQECESHHNRSGLAHDGGGFDLDGGCTNSVLQYNYSHDNDGAGYLLAQYPSAPPMKNLTVRYNISENDARRYNQGAIMIWSSGSNGGIQGADIYNNTVYLTPTADGSSPKAVYITSDGIAGITLRNNIIQTTKGIPLVTALATSGVRLEGNAYWSTGAPFVIQWGGTIYGDLATWRAASTQEQLGTQEVGLEAAPQFASGSNNAAANTLQLTPYRLATTSTLNGAGLNLRSRFGIDTGKRDFFGNPTPTVTGKANVGAYEVQAIALSTRRNVTQAAWCNAYPTRATDVVTLQFQPDLKQAVTIRVFDLQGRLHQTKQLEASQVAARETSVSVRGLAAGRYVLQVESGLLHTGLPLIVSAE